MYSWEYTLPVGDCEHARLLSRVHVVDRNVLLARLLVVHHRVPVAEGAALYVLTAQSHVVACRLALWLAGTCFKAAPKHINSASILRVGKIHRCTYRPLNVKPESVKFSKMEGIKLGLTRHNGGERGIDGEGRIMEGGGTFVDKGAECERLSHGPVDALTAVDHGAALVVHPPDLTVPRQVLGQLGDRMPHVYQHRHRDTCSVHAHMR